MNNFLSKVKMFGLPYHGVWQDGEITLPNGAKKAAPVPASGACILVKVPGLPPIERSTDEVADDIAAGREYRNYGLISGGYFGPIQIPVAAGEAFVIFIDSASKAWRCKIVKGPTNTLLLSLHRFARFSTEIDAWSDTVSVPVAAAFWASIIVLGTEAQASSGRDFVLSSHVAEAFPQAFLRMTISGTVDFSLPSLGLSIAADAIEYPGRAPYIERVTWTVTGSWIWTRTEHYVLKGGSGTTYDRVIVTTDYIQTSDSGEPDHDLWNFVSLDDVYESTKFGLVEQILGWAPRICAVTYIDDVMTTLTCTYSVNAQSFSHAEHRTGSNLFDYVVDSSAKNTSVVWAWGAVEIIKKTATESWPALLEQVQSGVTIRVDRINEVQPSGPTMIDLFSTQDSNGFNHYSAVMPVVTNGAPWASPVRVLCDAKKVSSYYELTPQSVISPTGDTIPTSLDYQNLFASWQPVSKIMSVTASRCCWF